MKTVSIAILLTLSLLGIVAHSHADQRGEVVPVVYLPIIFSAPDFFCADNSTYDYVSGVVYQHDLDNPVRPAYDHADKNIELRGYSSNADPSLVRELVDYGSGDPTQPPQLATLFNPNQVPPFSDFYQTHYWNWKPSPEPGTRGDIELTTPATAVSLILPPGDSLHVPTSGYDIGGGMEVIVIFADADTITLHYTRDDSAAVGYTVHIDNICTDPNLLALYDSLDAPDGPRYQYPSSSYDLPTLSAGQYIGTAGAGDMVVVIADTGRFQDTRSCNEWWQIRPGYAVECPPVSLK